MSYESNLPKPGQITNPHELGMLLEAEGGPPFMTNDDFDRARAKLSQLGVVTTRGVLQVPDTMSEKANDNTSNSSNVIKMFGQ